MAKKTKEVYGQKWSESVSQAGIELFNYRHARGPDVGGLGAEEHIKRAISELWPERMEGGGRGFVWNDFMERAAHAWCKAATDKKYAFQIWWGPSAVGKSTHAGLLVLADWLADPKNTTAIVCSTGINELMHRILGEIVRYHSLRPGLPGIWRPSFRSIVMGDENTKNGIFGVAVLQGTAKQAKDKIIGRHNRRIRLVIDEAQAQLEAPFDAITNLESAAESFIGLGIGNPDSRISNPLGRYAEPAKGWESINPDVDEEWETKRGVCLYFDGLKSPGITDKERCGFMLNEADLDKTRRLHGEDSLEWWQMRRGFVRTEGADDSIVPEALLIRGKAMEKAVFVGPTTKIGGLDASYSTGGDRCFFSVARVGMTDRGLIGIEFGSEYHIRLRISSGQPIAYFILEQVRSFCEIEGLLPRYLGIDVTGPQSVLADVFDREWAQKTGERVFRSNFGGSASMLPVSSEDSTPGCDKYENSVTELYYRLAEYIRFGQIHGLSPDAATEIVRRKVAKLKPRIAAETKTDYKKRSGQVSPDNADSKVVALDVARRMLMVVPGGASGSEGRSTPASVKELDVDGWSDNYHA